MSQSQSHLVYTILSSNVFRRHVSIAVSPGLYTILSTNVLRRRVSVSPGLYTILYSNVFRRHVLIAVSPGLYTILSSNVFRRHVSVSPGLYTILSTNMFRRHGSVSPGLHTILSTNMFRRHVSVSVSPSLCPPGHVWDSSLHPPVVVSSEPSQTTPATQNMKYPHIDHGQTVKTSVTLMTRVSWHHVTLVTWVSWRRAQCFLTVTKFCDRKCCFLRN